MKRFFLAALAIAAIASCTKNEVTPSINLDQEITFQTVISPTTKAGLGTGQVAFSTGNKFYAYAFFLPQGKTWATDYASSKKYIDNSLVGYSDNVWKASQTYYWPKQGTLTFFAWTDNTNAPSVAGPTAEIICAADKGMQFLNYDVTSNPNKDMMVAEMANDKIQNETTYLKTGVPTLFSHVLSQIQFKIKTKEDYSASATFALKSLTMKDVYAEGDYTQGSPTAVVAADIWNGYANTTDLSVYTNAGFSVTSTSDANALTLAANDYFIMLPQKFTDNTPKLEIVYTITTNYTGTEVVETVTEEVDLQTVYGAWEPGKTHVLTITLAMDEILWDPATVDWVADITPTTSF